MRVKNNIGSGAMFSMKDKEIDKIIASNLKRLRLLKELTQDKLGEKISVDGVYIAQIEGCGIGMGKKTMLKLCTALNVRPYEFYMEENTPIIKDEKEKEWLDNYRQIERLNLITDVRRYMKYRITEARIEVEQFQGEDKIVKEEKRQKTN